MFLLDVKILDMACSDADSGDNAQVSASISDGNSAGVFSSTQFQIFADTSMIDYEALRNTNYTYYLSVDVYDVPSEGPANTGRITIVAEVKVTLSAVNTCSLSVEDFSHA